MTSEEQRIAIAEACGWKWKELDEPGCWCWTRGSFFTNRPLFPEFRKKEDFVEDLPDYLSDLNAMHEAEKILNNVQQERYRTELVYTHAGMDVFATATQRVEAFLRTIGKWKEDA